MENKTHKLLPKLLSLQNRIMMWRQVGKTCSETEWDESELILDDLSKVIKAEVYPRMIFIVILNEI